MSTFAVTLETIDKVWPHSNADRLELASVAGMTFQFVVAKGSQNLGGQVLYFPVDSLLPDSIAEIMGLKGYLAGKNKDRVKTIKLRGEISQGVVGSPEKLLGSDWEQIDPAGYTELLGVTKYEPPVVMAKDAKFISLPDGVSVYDIEGADRYPDVAELLMDQPVLVMEKLEGTNFSITLRGDGFCINSRRHTVEPVEGVTHRFWEWVGRSKINEILQCGFFDLLDEGKQVTVRGEFVGPGVQKNIYKLGETRVYFFDVLVDGHYLGVDDFLSRFSADDVAPILSNGKTLRQWLAGRTIQNASDGKSIIGDCRREGIVIKPMIEQECEIGRLIIKQRSPEYLAGSNF